MKTEEEKRQTLRTLGFSKKAIVVMLKFLKNE